MTTLDEFSTFMQNCGFSKTQSAGLMGKMNEAEIATVMEGTAKSAKQALNAYTDRMKAVENTDLSGSTSGESAK